MRGHIGFKVGLTLIPFLLGSFIVLQFFIINEVKQSSQIQSETNLPNHISIMGTMENLDKMS